VNTHLGLRPLTFAELMECSAGWLERLCALRATTNKMVLVNAAAASDTLRFFIGICVVLLGFG
jgi:hypothetical protein